MRVAVASARGLAMEVVGVQMPEVRSNTSAVSVAVQPPEEYVVQPPATRMRPSLSSVTVA